MDNTVELSNVTKRYLETYQEILQTMMQKMTYITTTCSISDMFIRQIIPHQEAGIKMSENILKYTTNLEVQSIAQMIIKEQKENIENLKAVYHQCCKVQNSEYEVYEYLCAYKEIAECMFNEMCSLYVSNSVNVNYIREMIPYLQGGVQLASNALRFCTCAELIPILHCIINTYCPLIEEMQRLLNALGDC